MGIWSSYIKLVFYTLMFTIWVRHQYLLYFHSFLKKTRNFYTMKRVVCLSLSNSTYTTHTAVNHSSHISMLYLICYPFFWQNAATYSTKQSQWNHLRRAKTDMVYYLRCMEQIICDCIFFLFCWMLPDSITNFVSLLFWRICIHLEQIRF